PRLVFVVARGELSDLVTPTDDLALNACGCAGRARELLLRLAERRLLARFALSCDLPFELGEARARRDRLGFLRQVVLRVRTLHVAQILASLRCALLEVSKRRIVALPC